MQFFPSTALRLLLYYFAQAASRMLFHRFMRQVEFHNIRNIIGIDGMAYRQGAAACCSDDTLRVTETAGWPLAVPPVATAPAFPLDGPKTAKVAALVDRMLWQPGLTVATIAIEVGISRSVLYRHFAPSGGVVRFIIDRRVAALHRALSAPDETRSCAVLAMSCGFASPSHASRCFKARYGQTPSAYRATVAEKPDLLSQGSNVGTPTSRRWARFVPPTVKRSSAATYVADFQARQG